MSTHRNIDRICCAALALTVLLVLLLTCAAAARGGEAACTVMGYEDALFDAARVHTIDLVLDDWEGFLATCTDEAYTVCSVVIDGEAYRNIAIRAKGNTSLTQVAAYGNDRYSFKLEFDHYDSGCTYRGLDKLCLNNLIQDNTCMKDFLTYQAMAKLGVAAPLCSYVFLTVNGEDWGLYLAVEGVEESFLRRCFGTDAGALYKPDSSELGGGRGNGQGFDAAEFFADFDPAALPEPGETDEIAVPMGGQGGFDPFSGGGAGDFTPPEGEAGTPTLPEGDPGGGAGGGLIGDDDALLRYIDDDPDSYPSIFDNAKTAVSAQDKTRLIESLRRLFAGEALDETVDIEAVIRYFVVHNFVLNFDSYTGSMIHNYYLYEQDGQLQLIPWDYNLAFGGFSSGTDATALVNYPIDTPVSGGSVEDRPMLAWIFASEDATALYHACFEELLTWFDSGEFEAAFDRVVAMLTPYIERDPTKFCTTEEFQTGAATLREFCLLRAQSIRGQLDGTIGATADTQDARTLVSAGALSISAMGGMNFGGAPGDFAMGGEMEWPDEAAQPSDAAAQPPDAAMQRPDAAAQPPDAAMQRPDGGAPDEADASGGREAGILLLASVLALAFGLAFAARRWRI